MVDGTAESMASAQGPGACSLRLGARTSRECGGIAPWMLGPG